MVWMALSTNSTHSEYLPSQHLFVCCMYILPLGVPKLDSLTCWDKRQEKKSLNQGVQGFLKGNERIRNEL